MKGVNENKMTEIQAIVDEIHTNMKLKEKEAVLNTNSDIFFQDKSPITLNKLKKSFRVVEVEI